MQCHFILAGCLVCLPQNEWVCDIEMDLERSTKRERERGERERERERGKERGGGGSVRVCVCARVHVRVCLCVWLLRNTGFWSIASKQLDSPSVSNSAAANGDSCVHTGIHTHTHTHTHTKSEQQVLCIDKTKDCMFRLKESVHFLTLLTACKHLCLFTSACCSILKMFPGTTLPSLFWSYPPLWLMVRKQHWIL